MRQSGREPLRPRVLLTMAAAAAVLLLTLVVAYANGANDVSKGIATLVGSGVTDFRAALLWGAVWTVVGALLAALASQGLVSTFSGKGFLASPIRGEAFLGAVAAGAAVWVIFASRTGLPVSTTHAIAGSLAGAGVAAQGAAALHWAFLAQKVALPLALSPFLSVALLYAVSPLLRSGLARAGRYCLCLERRVALPAVEAAFPDPSGSSLLAAGVDSPKLASREECRASPAIAGRLDVLDGLHWVSAALMSLARGLNDAPKILALGVAASALFGVTGVPFYAAVAAGIGAGSVLSGLRVTETLACRVTPMTPSEGFSANLITTALVGLASWNSLPVSTTHISSGAIIGIGLRGRNAAVRWRTVRDMALAWFLTLPAAAAVGGAAYALLR